MKFWIFTLFIGLTTSLNAQNAFIQFLHNSSDVDLEKIKISIDDVKTDSLTFRKATPYLGIEASGNKLISISFLDKNDSVVLKKDSFSIESNKNYICILQGVKNISDYKTNPTGENVELAILWIENALKDTLSADSSFKYLFVNGITDAPKLDIAKDSVTLVDDIVYGEKRGYIDILNGVANLHLLSSDGSFTLYSYKTNFADIKIPVVLFMSGFITPSANKNGSFFELLALLPDGSVINLNNVTSSKENIFSQIDLKVFPNPASNYLRVSMNDFDRMDKLKYTIYSNNGQLVSQPNIQYNSEINISDLPTGIYFIEFAVTNQKQSLLFMKY